MKKSIALAFTLFVSLTLFSNNNDSPVEAKSETEIDSLIDNSQYASAWIKICDTHQDSSASTIIKKSEFCLKYFSHTSFHLKFYFIDLLSGETLLQIRQGEVSTSEVFADFNPEENLLNTIGKDQDNPYLHYSLGKYYYDVFLSYHNSWRKSSKETMALYYYHFMEAHKQKIKTALSCYAISYFYQSRRTNVKAESFLLEALQINPKYAAAHYNLAYSYSVQDSTDLALYHAQLAFDNYEIKSLKADAASMCGILFSDLNKHEDAINWLLISDAMNPGTVIVYETLLISYLALKKKGEALLITKNLYAYDWRTGRIFNGILDAYTNEKQTDDLQLFLTNEITSGTADKEYQGFTYMHLTQMHINLLENGKAKTNLDKAKSCFDICYDKDHAIYRVLEKLDWTIKQP